MAESWGQLDAEGTDRVGGSWRVWFGVAVAAALAAYACGGGDADSAEPTDDPEAGPTETVDDESEPAESVAGTEPAPEFPIGLTWFNVSEPLTFEALRGKMVLLDFWTQGCINCQHIIPDLKRLEAEFGDSLVVIGVHSGKYSEEAEDEAVAEAIARYGLEHPVVNDPAFVVWRQWGATAWPTVVLIDPRGNVVGGRAGESVYPVFQPIMVRLHAEFEELGLINETPIPLSLETAVASTFLSFPSEVLADEAGDRLFIADAGHHRIVVTHLDGVVINAIGSGEAGFADGGPDQAQFRDPQGLELSPDGKTLWVADTRNHAVREVDLATGEVTTIAGTGTQVFSFEPGLPATETGLASPWDIHYHDGWLYISMAGTHQIWSLALGTGFISVFAGTRHEGLHDGNRLDRATLAQPSGIAGDDTHLYWVDPESSSVRRVAYEGSGDVETLIGRDLFAWGDVDGRAGTAKIQHAQGLALDGGVVYIADTYNHKVKALTLADDEVATLAGGGERGWLDGVGAEAAFEEPNSLSVARGLLYLADTGNHVIRVIDPATAGVTTLALTNLSAAGPAQAGNVLRVELPTQVVAPGVATLRVTLRSPPDFHLNSAAPSRLTLATNNPAVADLGETVLTWESDEPSITLPVPISLREGEAELTGQGVVYYCRGGEEALCQIQHVELVVPITVSEDASAGEIIVDYLLPATDPTYGES